MIDQHVQCAQILVDVTLFKKALNKGGYFKRQIIPILSLLDFFFIFF